MPPRTVRSFATAAVLVAGLMTASTASATAAQAGDGAAPSAASTSRAAGLIVTSLASEGTIVKAAEAVLDGDASIDDVSALSPTQQVISFDDDVAAGVAERIARRLDASSSSVSVEPDYIRTIADASPVQVNDPLFGQQGSIWDTTRPGGGYSTKAPAFWTRTMGSPTVRVAVLDTGMTAHPDLTWAAGRDFVDDDADPSDPGGTTSLLGSTSNGFHGTHVAGIVAARANNGIGVTGVAPGVTIVPVRVLDGSGSGSDSDIAAGILWSAGVTVRGVANPAPVQVINMSLGGPGSCTSVFDSAIRQARSRGVVVVAAAGNESADAANSVPANCSGVIAVGATDAAGKRASFSNFGATVDISAPGVEVLSTVSLGSGRFGYARESGTSMASPAVAGAAALLFSTGLASTQVDAALPAAVTPATSPGTAGVLDLNSYRRATAAPPSTRVSMKVTSTVAKGKRASVRVRLLSSTGAKPYGRIRVFDGTKIIRKATVSVNRRGSISVRTPRLHRKGVHRIKVVFLGDGVFGNSRSVTRKVTVR